MREGIGGIQLFLIVVVMVLIFAGVMSLTLNQANAFAVKDQIVSIIETAGGFDTSAQCFLGNCNMDNKDQATLQNIVDSLESNSYRQQGSCEDIPFNENGSVVVDMVGYQRNGDKTLSGKKSSFCIAKIDSNKSEDTLKGYYYRVYVFYQLDIPVLHAIFNFRAIGETKLLYS